MVPTFQAQASRQEISVSVQDRTARLQSLCDNLRLWVGDTRLCLCACVPVSERERWCIDIQLCERGTNPKGRIVFLVRTEVRIYEATEQTPASAARAARPTIIEKDEKSLPDRRPDEVNGGPSEQVCFADQGLVERPAIIHDGTMTRCARVAQSAGKLKLSGDATDTSRLSPGNISRF